MEFLFEKTNDKILVLFYTFDLKTSIIYHRIGVHVMKLTTDCFDINHLDQYKKNGIDRIIVSLASVSVRSVKVLNTEELRQVVLQAHELDLEVALNMLNFMMEEEIDTFKNVLLDCKEMGVDKIYYADMGVYQLAKEIGIADKLIYQPTTLIASSSDANHYLQLGIHKVVLSREITFEEMKHILEHCKGCEVGVFGYNAMMHSKRKLLSSYFEFAHLQDKSDSKHLYLMEENRHERMPIFEDFSGTHVLSGSVFAMFKEIIELKDCDFKIEGIHLDEAFVLQVAKDICDIVDGRKDGKEVFELYQQNYPELNITDGFMYKRTSLVKEDC